MESLKSANGFTAPEHTEAEKQRLYDGLSEEQKKNQTYTEWVKEAYADQYEKWMPWIEDQYLRWFGKGDNKASYATKDTLNKAKITGIPQIDQLQDDVHNLVGNQVGDKGFFAPVGKLVGKEGINRAERGGRDDEGGYVGESVVGGMKGAGEGVVGGVESVGQGAQSVGQGVAGGAQSVGGTVVGGAKGAGGYLGGMLGGGKKEGEEGK